MRTRLDLVPGDKYGRLTIIKFHHADKRSRRHFFCSCECGEKKVIHGAAMVSGNTRSCGCLAKESGSKRRISDNHSEVTAIILGYKRHAKDRGLAWLLTREQVKKIILKNCFYCGVEPTNVKKTKNSIGDGLKYSGIDRINSSDGYEEHNVVPACRICNYAKSSMDISEFNRWAVKIGAMADQWSNL